MQPKTLQLSKQNLIPMEEILYYFGRLESLYQQIVSDADIYEGIDSINPDYL